MFQHGFGCTKLSFFAIATFDKTSLAISLALEIIIFHVRDVFFTISRILYRLISNVFRIFMHLLLISSKFPFRLPNFSKVSAESFSNIFLVKQDPLFLSF